MAYLGSRIDEVDGNTDRWDTLVDTRSPDTKKLYQAHATREDDVRLLEKETSVRWTPNRCLCRI